MPQGETFHRAVSNGVPISTWFNSLLNIELNIFAVLFISQIYGLLPVSNVRALDVADIRFRWCSPRILYSLLIGILNLSEFGAVINYVIKVTINFHTSSTLSLYIVCLLEHLFFWRLAIQWPRIMRTWHGVEQLFLRVPYRFYGEYRIKRRIYIVFTIVMSSALGECLLKLIIQVQFLSILFSGTLSPAGQLISSEQYGAHPVQDQRYLLREHLQVGASSSLHDPALPLLDATHLGGNLP